MFDLAISTCFFTLSFLFSLSSPSTPGLLVTMRGSSLGDVLWWGDFCSSLEPCLHRIHSTFPRIPLAFTTGIPLAFEAVYSLAFIFSSSFLTYELTCLHLIKFSSNSCQNHQYHECPAFLFVCAPSVCNQTLNNCNAWPCLWLFLLLLCSLKAWVKESFYSLRCSHCTNRLWNILEILPYHMFKRMVNIPRPVCAYTCLDWSFLENATRRYHCGFGICTNKGKLRLQFIKVLHVICTRSVAVEFPCSLSIPAKNKMQQPCL